MSCLDNSWSGFFAILRFLGLIQYYLEKNDHSLIKSALMELYSKLSYITLSGARDFRFEAVSDLAAKISFLLKQSTLQNIKKTEIDHIKSAQMYKRWASFCSKN